MRPLLDEDPTIVVLRSQFRGYAAAASAPRLAERRWVAIVGPDPPATFAAPAPADRPIRRRCSAVGALPAVLSAVGAGWVVRLGGGPRWLRLALAPAIGVALLVPTCLLGVGIRVGGIGGAFVVVALAGAGLVAAIVGREAEEEAPAPDGALPCSGPRPPAHEGEHRPVTTRNEAIDILDAGTRGSVD